MLWKIKNFLFNLCKKKTVLFVFFFAFLGLVYPRISSAFIVELAKKIAVAPFYYIIYVIVSIAVYMAGWAGSLLSWILSPDFISYSYTNPGGANPNPVIRTGLAVTQGFANMFLVLILVYIAIATILQLADYKTKRILVIFIVVALLVNFSPVICGLIVDASNIIMNFFIQDLSVDTFSETMGAKVAEMKTEYWVETEEGPVSQLVQLAVLVPFLFVLTFILLLFALIFMLRYIAIWLLVILSPIAFICYILPITKKYFDQWWQQFINWSFIGVTCSFFLYLALFLVMQLETNPGVAISTPDIPDSSPTFNAIMPYFVAIVFLGIGLVFGLATSAAGASTAISLAKRGQKASAKWTGGRIAQKGIRPLLEKARAKEAVGHIARVVEKVPVARWFLPEKARLYGQMKPAVDKAQTQAKKYSSQTLSHRILKGADTQIDSTGNLTEIIERGDAEDLFNEARKLKVFKDKAKKMGKEKLSDQDILESEDFQKRLIRPLQISQRGGSLNSKILRQDPRLAQLVAGKEWAGGYKDMTKKEAVQEATRQARRQHINQMEREVLENETVVETMMEKGREVPEAVVSQVKKGQEAMLDTIDTLFSKYIDNILSKTNATLANTVRTGDPKNTKVAWDQFRKDFKKDHQDKDGYFKYVEGQRASEMGWRMGQYKAPDKKEPPTAGEASMGNPPPEERTKPLRPGEETEEEKKSKPNK